MIVSFRPQVSSTLINIGLGQSYTITPSSYECPEATGYSWSWAYTYPSGHAVLNDFNTYAVVSFGQLNVFTLFAKSKNKCGTSPSPTFIYNFNVVNYQTYVSAYPNPVSNTLSVEIREDSDGQKLTNEFTVNDTKFTRAEPTYNIRLFDSQGNMVRQFSSKEQKVEINVSNLKNGFYYLHVHDDSGNKAETKTIIVKH